MKNREHEKGKEQGMETMRDDDKSSAKPEQTESPGLRTDI